MNRYKELTQTEKLALNYEEFIAAVKLEGIERGIKPPTTLENFLNQQPFTGFTIPADSVFFYEVMVPGEYGENSGSGLAFKTIEEARAAMNNAIALCESGYGSDKKSKIVSGIFSVREVSISLSRPKSFSVTINEFAEDNTEYHALCDECSKDLSNLRQGEYDAKVLARKRAEYLSLANGNIDIAKNFWAKTERTEFPEAINA